MSNWPTLPAPAGIMSNRYKPTDMPDLTGKVAVVVGGSRGIGEATAMALAHKGCEVHIISATSEHADQAIKEILHYSTAQEAQLHKHITDLGDLHSLIPTIQDLAKTLPRLDILYLIAGIGVAPWGLTKSGLGNHFGVNNVAQMAITDILLPVLKKTSEGKMSQEEKWTTRIVAESSELHRTAPSWLKFGSLEEVGEGCKDEDPTQLYGMSKLGNMLFIKQLAHHLPPLTSNTPILALSTHPGAVATEQQKGATEAYGLLGKALEVGANMMFMSKEQGSESALWAGTSPAVGERREEVQGMYFTEADGKVGSETDQGKDQALAKRFWDLCVKALKEKANYDVKM